VIVVAVLCGLAFLCTNEWVVGWVLVGDGGLAAGPTRSNLRVISGALALLACLLLVLRRRVIAAKLAAAVAALIVVAPLCAEAVFRIAIATGAAATDRPRCHGSSSHHRTATRPRRRT
jgi:hypothetical protein